MDWLIFALVAPAIFSVGNFVDKYNLERQIKDFSIIPVYSGVTGLLIGTIFWVINGFQTLDLFSAALVYLSPKTRPVVSSILEYKLWAILKRSIHQSSKQELLLSF